MKKKVIDFLQFAFVVVLLVGLFGWTFTRLMERNKPQEEGVFIFIDGKPYELVFDDYDNPFIKQTFNNQTLYIPYPFEMEETEDVEEFKPKK